MRSLITVTVLWASFASISKGQTWEIYHSDNSELPDNHVYALYVDSYGGKWFGTSQGLLHFKDGMWNTYTISDGLGSNMINDITGGISIPSGQLFVSTANGVSEINYDETGITGISTLSVSNSGLQSDSISTIAVDTGVIFYGSREGLNIQTGETWTFLDQISTSEGLRSLKEISAMAVTPHGWNFVGTETQGVARVRVDVDGVSGASSYSTEWSGLLSDQIYDIHITQEGHQWYATDRGLAYHEGYETKDNWDTYTELSSDLISNRVFAVAVDNNGTTWSGTDRGISRFDGVNWLSISSIVGVSDFSVFDLAFDSDGSIWFASNKGVIHYDESGIADGLAPAWGQRDLSLHCYPTFVSDEMTITYDVTDRTSVTIDILDLQGKIISRLRAHKADSGPYKFKFSINDQGLILPSGPYIIMMRTKKDYLTQKIIIIR